ncbi:MAG: multidrug effflux MFS transporter [Pseudomonadota bacterium]
MSYELEALLPKPPVILPFLIVAYALASLLTMDMYLPAMPTLERVLQTTPGQVQLTMTVYLIGFAFSQLLYGPLSDRYGRRPVMLLGGLGFVIATILCAVSTTIEILIAARFLQGLTIGSLTVTCRATLRELYEPKRGTKLLAYISMAEGLSLAAGPIIGAEILLLAGWRWTFWVVAILAGSALIGLFFALPESNRRKNSQALHLRPLLTIFGRLLTTRRFIGYALPGGCAFAGLMAYYTVGSFLLRDAGLTPREFSQMQAIVVIAYLSGLGASSRLVERFGFGRLIVGGFATVAIGALSMPALAFAGIDGVWAIVVPLAVYAVGIGSSMAPLIMLALSVNPAATGTVAATFGMLTMSIGGLGSLTAHLAYNGHVLSLAIPVACMAILSVVFFALLRPRRLLSGDTVATGN